MHCKSRFWYAVKLIFNADKFWLVILKIRQTTNKMSRYLCLTCRISSSRVNPQRTILFWKRRDHCSFYARIMHAYFNRFILTKYFTILRSMNSWRTERIVRCLTGSVWQKLCASFLEPLICNFFFEIFYLKSILIDQKNAIAKSAHQWF